MICTALVIGLHLGTYHFNREEQYQELNPGVYVSCDNVTIGAYYNSYKDPAAYAVYTYRSVFDSPIDLSVGAVIGYKRPMIVIMPSYKWDNIRISFIPPFKKDIGGIHFSLEW